jgi:vacuolar-type H+-ATPase subunit H
MPDIISEIVSEDEKARNRVQAVKEEKAQLSSKLRSQRAAIEEKHQNRANDYVQKYKEELNQKMILEKKRFEESYNKSLQSLLEQYEACREPWVQSIYNNCIHK